MERIGVRETVQAVPGTIGNFQDAVTAPERLHLSGMYENIRESIVFCYACAGRTQCRRACPWKRASFRAPDEIHKL